MVVCVCEGVEVSECDWGMMLMFKQSMFDWATFLEWFDWACAGVNGLVVSTFRRLYDWSRGW